MKTLHRLVISLVSFASFLPLLSFAQQTGGNDKPATGQPFSVYDRHIHMSYALKQGKVLKQSDEELLAALDQVPGGVTSVSPFLLNVDDPSKYASMLNAMRARGIAVFIGVGMKAGMPNWGYDSKNMRDLAKRCAPFSDSIRIDNTQGWYDVGGREPIQGYIDYLLSIGFKHIMINPWPVDKGGKIVPFTGVESNFIEVTLKHDHKTGEIYPYEDNFKPKADKINALLAVYPATKIIVNYESEPQHRALARMEKEKPGSSLPAMEITAAICQKNGWSWAPPWTKIYDPLALGTWKWIAARLGQMKADTAPAPALNPAPTNKATGVPLDTQLKWRGGALRKSSEIYFGTTPKPQPPPAAAAQTDTTFNPGPLQPNTTYYWGIVEVNQHGKTVGPIWSFTTK